MGNICRSPLAEAEARRAFAQAGLGEQLSVCSAGTIGFHQGHAADPRSIELGQRVGLDLNSHRARIVTAADFERAGLIIAMDRRNIADLRARAPAHSFGRIRLLLEFAGQAQAEVPDPYSGGRKEFEHSYALIQAGVEGLTKHLSRLHNAGQLVTE